MDALLLKLSVCVAAGSRWRRRLLTMLLGQTAQVFAVAVCSLGRVCLVVVARSDRDRGLVSFSFFQKVQN